MAAPASSSAPDVAAVPETPGQSPGEEPDIPPREKDTADESHEDDEESALLPKGVDKRPRRDSMATSNPVRWLRLLGDRFGHQLLATLAVTQFVIKGFVMGFTSQAENFLYKTRLVPAPQVQIYQGVSMMPWAMKPVIGIVSDLFPIGGLNKAPYMFGSSVIGCAACVGIALVPTEHLPVIGIVICMLGLQLQIATNDLLTEARYAEEMQLNPRHGPDLVSYVWGGMMIGNIVAGVFAGPTIQYLGARIPFLICIPLCASVLVPLSLGWLGESEVNEAELARNRKRFSEQKEVCVLCALMFLGTTTLSIVGMFTTSPLVNAIVGVTIVTIMIISFGVMLTPAIAKVNTYFVIQASLAFSIQGASFYFYTDSKREYKEGPHFSPMFYTTVLGTVGSIFSLVGIMTYGKYLKHLTYRHLMVVTTLVHGVLSACDLLLYSRYNLELGIPDYAFVLGADVLGSVMAQWKYMPGIVLMAYLCPSGMEATMYALLAGCNNLGQTVASNCGALLLNVLGTEPRGEAHESSQFKYLWVASAWSTTLPIVCVFLIYYLIPDAHQNERLVEDGEMSVTRGSLWKRWRGTE